MVKPAGRAASAKTPDLWPLDAAAYVLGMKIYSSLAASKADRMK